MKYHSVLKMKEILMYYKCVKLEDIMAKEISLRYVEYK